MARPMVFNVSQPMTGLDLAFDLPFPLLLELMDSLDEGPHLSSPLRSRYTFRQVQLEGGFVAALLGLLPDTLDLIV